MDEVELELRRLAQIQEVLGADLPEIVGGMVDSMSTAIAQVEDAMAGDELDRAAKAAHACRNDALMIGARRLLVALTELENAARGGQERLAREQLAEVREAWPGTRDALVRAAASQSADSDFKLDGD
jgi:HPt (histidine-containing phosphotransfer) domain-containing protein